MFKVNNKDTKTTPGIFIVSFEHISHRVLVFRLLTLNMQMPAGLNEVFSDDYYGYIKCCKKHSRVARKLTL